jgi:hypothetical protein
MPRRQIVFFHDLDYTPFMSDVSNAVLLWLTLLAVGTNAAALTWAW